MRCYAVMPIVVLLLGCSANERATKPWLVDELQGCLIPPEYASYAQQLSWDGNCYDGEAIGHGTLRWVEPDGNIGFLRTCLRPEHRLAGCSMGSGRS